jgi:alkylation response protein AidB-like acyl-CoA dehydrogenase
MSNVLSEMMSSEVQFRAPLLTDEMLMRFHERAPIYDRENRFFTEDFEELREAGYLALAVPQVLGGMGMNLAEVCRQQRRLAYYAPATA